MTRTRIRTRSCRRTSALVLAFALLGAACSSHHGTSASPSSTTSTPAGPSSKPFTKRIVKGTAVIRVGSSTWSLQVTNCIVGKDRITAQGDDRKGRTVVATFTRTTKKGSVTVTDAREAWAVGPAGGTTVSQIEVTGSSIKGSGTFAHRTMAIVPGPTVSGTGATGKGAGKATVTATTAPAHATTTTAPAADHRTASGSFDLTCTKTTPA